MDRLKILKKESSEGTFHYADLGSELHGRTSFRIWVSSHLVECDEYGDEFVPLPAKAVVHKTPKGNFVLKPNNEYLTFVIGKKCGYRGGSWYEILSKHEVAVPFEIWDSPCGNLGISKYALVSVAIEDMPLKYRWERDGRLYGAESVGISIVKNDGTTSTFGGIDDVDDINDIASALEE